MAGDVVGSVTFSDTSKWQDIALGFAKVDNVTFSGGYYFLLDNVTVNAATTVPEPGTIALLGTGCLCIGTFLRHRRTAA